MNYYVICNQLFLIENDLIKTTTMAEMIEELNTNPMYCNYNKTNTFISLDTETEGEFNFTNKMLSLQLGNSNNLYFIAYQYLTSQELSELSIFMNFSDHIFIAHNALYDLKYLRINKLNPKNVYCTLLVEKLCYGGLKQEKGFYSLKELCYRYFSVTLNKDIRGKINNTSINDSEVIFYALDDIKYLMKIVNIQLEYLAKIEDYPQFNKDDITDIYRLLGLENAAVAALAECELIGLGYNYKNLDNVTKVLNAEFDDVLNSLFKETCECPILSKHLITQGLFGKEYILVYPKTGKPKTFNWSSATQKLKALRLVIPEIQNTTGEELYEHLNKHPIISILVKYNTLFKLKSSFVDTLPHHINKVTNRVHTSFNQLLNTGRMSCSNPNLMQIPSKGDLGAAIRSCFGETGKYSIVNGDWSGCELGIIAHNSGDPLWINTINEGGDLHGILASKTFDIPMSDIRNKTPFNADVTYRDVQKSIDFGLAYGMSKFKLAIVMKIIVDAAQAIIDKFFKVVPKVKKYLHSLGRFAVNNYFCVTNAPYFRIRRFELDTTNGKRERAGKNHPIQGTNADMVKLAMVRVIRERPDNRIKLMLPVHDEILTRCPDDLTESWKVQLTEIMESVAKSITPTVTIRADVKINKEWKK